jgi:hypothetical protein
MKRITLLRFIFAVFIGLSPTLYGQTKEIKYRYETSLKALSDDKLAVRLKIEGFSEDSLTYCFPKIVPGIYGAMNFGQYISNFAVFDKKGKKLKIEKRDVN